MPPTQLAYPSPKRKREQPPPTRLLNTALRPASTPPRGSPPPSSGGDSPRNVVADQLRGMTLVATATIPMSPLTPIDDVIRKKPKLDAMRVDSATSLEANSTKGHILPYRRSANSLDSIPALHLDPAREIPETPQSQPRTSSDFASLAHPTAFVSSTEGQTTEHLQTTSLKPRMHNRSSSEPGLRNKSPSPSPSALTWHDGEITGHLAGPATDPDDDGTGLNGIGFRPTPAIAYARSQKRRQQLNDWRARESREARLKRQERRRRGVGGNTSREATVEREIPANEVKSPKRTVKFAI